MDPNTGNIHYFNSEKDREFFEKKTNKKLIPLTEEKAKELRPLSKRKRIWLMKRGSCICGSGKSFKKCCWRKYK